jgi:predicted signal transduction protein with EAL and GGDEF domain
MKSADIALYAAKNNNRGECRIFDPGMRADVDKRDRVAAALHSEVAAGRLSVALQPQVALDDGRHVGFEALARWNWNGRPVPPADFIPIAEETGLIVQLGTCVLEKSLATARALERPWFRFGTIAVNVAAAQLKLDDFVAQVAECSAAIGLHRTTLSLRLLRTHCWTADQTRSRAP